MFENIGWDEMRYVEYAHKTLGDECSLLDVGFNRGEFTDYWMTKFPKTTVFGFEPVPELYQNALRKYFHNHNIHLHNYGLSDHEENNIPFYYLQDGYDGMSSIHYRPRYYPQYNVKNITVNIRKFDDIAYQFPKVNYIKCDVEGHDYFVMKGMSTFLEFSHPKFFAYEVGENLDDAGVTCKQIVDFLYSKKYIIWNREFAQVTPDNFVEERADSQNFLAEYKGE